jgi:hypothetical protein
LTRRKPFLAPHRVIRLRQIERRQAMGQGLCLLSLAFVTALVVASPFLAMGLR